MAGQKSGSAGDKARYTRYKSEMRFEKNKRRKIEKHLKKFPNDERAKNALKGISYSRKTPNAPTFFKSRENKEFAHTYRLVGGNTKNLKHIFELERKVYDRPAHV